MNLYECYSCMLVNYQYIKYVYEYLQFVLATQSNCQKGHLET